MKSINLKTFLFGAFSLLRTRVSAFSLGLAALLLTGCGERKAQGNWMSEDDVEVAIDETFAPIMQNIVDTFGMTYKEANMKPLFCSEDSAIRLLVRDSLRCCVATRKLTDNELKLVEGHTLSAMQALVATDAIALIVNKENGDSLISVDELKGIVTGRITRWEQLKHSSRKGELKLVFDHSGSSTVRYMKDSLCNGNAPVGNVYASEGGTNLSVIDMVKQSTEIIGVVGTNWLKAKGDSVLTSFKGLDVTVMKVGKSGVQPGEYVRPFQYYIATADYPLLRSVYVITTDPRRSSLLKTFYFFVKGQKGQTIICNNSQLLPYSPVQVKQVSVN